MGKALMRSTMLVALVAGALISTQAQQQPALRRLDPSLDKIIAPDAKIEKIAEGFRFTEGPVWVRNGGYLLFSDIPANKIHKWTPDGKVSVYLEPSGFTGG